MSRGYRAACEHSRISPIEALRSPFGMAMRHDLRRSLGGSAPAP
jgi:hypothetical protein